MKYFFSQIVKLGQTELMSSKYIKKQYSKEPKQRPFPVENIEDLYFRFHCSKNMPFDSKIHILEDMCLLRPNSKIDDLSKVGVLNVVKSISEDLLRSSYNDVDEYNISQFINILHKIELFETEFWVTAMDNYHKQGVLNWVQYRQFTHSVYDFSFRLTEEWQLNIARDICQEAWNDFIGFLENKFTLNISEEEICVTYQHLRKFGTRAHVQHVHVILRYFMHHLSLHKEMLTQSTYLFLLLFCLDQSKYPHMEQILRSLFTKVIEHVYIDTKFQLNQLFTEFDIYYSLLDLLILREFHQDLEMEIKQALFQALVELFTKNQLEGNSYLEIKNLVKLKALLSQQTLIEAFDTDELSLKALENIHERKQNLLAIVQLYKLLEDKSKFLGVLAKSNLRLSDVEFSNTELIQFLKDLDDTDLVYYLNDFLESSLDYIADNINAFSPDDWCFAFYLIYKYVVKEHATPEKFEGSLSVMKQYIKLHYMTNYRRALPVNSSFYKILSVVELEVFFADDPSNLY